MAQHLNQLLDVLESEGPLSSSRLQTLLGISQPTLSRLLARAGDRILRIGRARATLYALARPVHGTAGPIPLYAIDAKGRPRQLANLHGLAAGQYFIEAENRSRWLQGEAGNGLYASIPYFLYDLRPQGFMGRQIARHYARLYSYPEDPRQWNDDQIIHYLLRNSDDTPGQFILGEQALMNFQQQDLKVIANRKIFTDMADSILSEGPPGSSAGGEHQKFTAYTKDNGHVIVKFSPSGDAVDAQRWSDLLVCEHHALACMNQAGIDAAQSELHSIKGRTYLEVTRFDRVGTHGRKTMISLAAIDAEFTGAGQQWSQTARRLQQTGLLTEADVRTCSWSDLFGQWVGNSDRHLGNISATITEDGFSLLPIYDMLPMMYAPVRGEIIQRTLNPPVRPMQHEDLWQQTARVAQDFWGRVMQDERITSGFRKIAEGNTILISQTI